MPRKKRQADAVTVMESPAQASEHSPALTVELTEPSAPLASADSNEQEHAENEAGKIRNRFTSSLAGVQAGINFKYKGQPHIEFADDRPPSAEEKQLLDSHGENDPKFRYRGVSEKRWIGPSTPEARDKAISVAQKIAGERLKTDGAKSR